MNPSMQGSIGEMAAASWLLGEGYAVAIPSGHQADCDLWAEIDADLCRVQVKTSTYFRKGVWRVVLSTRGGNRSWSGVAKLFDSSRCDYLFVLVGDGRQWFIPSGEIDGGQGINLGGHKYSSFEVRPGRPIEAFRREAVGRSKIFAAPRRDVRVVKGDAL